MPLFVCRKCNCVDNTALTGYWHKAMERKPALCSECDPEIGKWHGEFPKTNAAGWLVGEDGFVWQLSEEKAGMTPRHVKMLGVVSELTELGEDDAQPE